MDAGSSMPVHAPDLVERPGSARRRHLAPRRTATAALRILGRDHDRIDPFAARPSLQ